MMNMTDRVMGYQSFQRASSPACECVFKRVKEWKEKGKESTWQQQALRPHHSVYQFLAPVGFQAWLPHPCYSAAAMHAPTACVCERNWSVWGQMCT